jgi:FtsP/CotA-like multicopper oxidase with cupredoxin domain
VALIGASALAGGGPVSQAASVSVNLCAVTGSVDLPGDPDVPIWAFTDGGSGASPDCGGAASSATLPGGPQLAVMDGDSVTLNVANALGNGHELSFEIPGVTGSTSIADGATGTVTFTAAAGAHVYQSGGDAGRQEAMGLYGALIVHAAAGQAYAAASSAYDVEAPLVLSEIDPAFNAAPENFDMTGYRATYWLINGKAYPDTAPIAAAAGQNVLLRYLNAGYDNTSMTLLGMHQRVIARDGRMLGNPFDAVADTIPAGATEDTVATVPASVPPSSSGFALYNRNLHITNGATAADPARGAYSTPGGMLTFIAP